ncbi:MAG: GNAT family N-acetyltransferase [Gammaproteobacteria bacterium]|nr:MAG: GNAT family N-acetyltransferase [Gammaproteobacteria bacterium]RLA54400.1 MAG: GNAT family N-acetyltransferase [Gammaproteobacteria bacterium]
MSAEPFDAAVAQCYRQLVTNFPFLKAAFLQALADSGSVGPNTGWLPEHTIIEEGDQTLAFMPTYIKDHSWGEYVFDWAWANAYQRNGLNYYPKLVSAIPFSPVTGPKVRFAEKANQQRTSRQLIDKVLSRANELGASSWHLLFPDAQTLSNFSHPELMRRSGVQFHWFNRDYQCFDDFLATFVSRKRKMVRKERRRIAEQDIDIKTLEGAEIDHNLWAFFYRLYQNTYLKRSGGGGYLTPEFFVRLGETLAENLAMAVATINGERIACALYFHDGNTLYGRYWGCVREYEYLHFELCYYQGIDYAIAHQLKKFDAGAQGEHKILRGFEPVETHSLHWIKHPGFAEAIGRFIDQEQLDNSRYIAGVQSVLPYKQDIIANVHSEQPQHKLTGTANTE